MNTQELRECILSCEPEFTQLILKRMGIVVRNQNTDLMNSIINACNKFQCNPKEYLDRLIHCADNSPLLEHLITDITVGETYFFRDKQQMNWLKNTLLPKIIKVKREQNNLSLRIWSAAGSSGEEIYTIAILLKEMLPDIHRWSLHLLSTDINTVALRKARTGIYSKWSMRSIPDYYKHRYFSETNNQFYISPKLIDMVNFQYLNLNDPAYPSIFNETNAQDLIICRNVLIYFSKECSTQLMKRISSCLTEAGTLLLGASDPVHIQGTDLIFHHDEGMVFTRQSASVPTPIPSPLVQKRIPKDDKTPIRKLITQNDILNLLDNGRWQEALTLMNTEDSTTSLEPHFLLGAKAKASANLGQLIEAVHFCEESLLLNSTDKDIYFIYALSLIELDRLTDAEKALRKTLFIERNFVEGHFQLGLLLIKNKKIEAGLKSLRNALAIVESNDPSCMVEGFKELNYGRFAEILKSEIELVAGSAYDKSTEYKK